MDSPYQSACSSLSSLTSSEYFTPPEGDSSSSAEKSDTEEDSGSFDFNLPSKTYVNFSEENFDVDFETELKGAETIPNSKPTNPVLQAQYIETTVIEEVTSRTGNVADLAESSTELAEVMELRQRGLRFKENEEVWEVVTEIEEGDVRTTVVKVVTVKRIFQIGDNC